MIEISFTVLKPFKRIEMRDERGERERERERGEERERRERLLLWS